MRRRRACLCGGALGDDRGSVAALDDRNRLPGTNRVAEPLEDADHGTFRPSGQRRTAFGRCGDGRGLSSYEYVRSPRFLFGPGGIVDVGGGRETCEGRGLD